MFSARVNFGEVVKMASNFSLPRSWLAFGEMTFLSSRIQLTAYLSINLSNSARSTEKRAVLISW